MVFDFIHWGPSMTPLLELMCLSKINTRRSLSLPCWHSRVVEDANMRFLACSLIVYRSCLASVILCNIGGSTDKATETVIYRIFYYVNRSGNGRLTLRELKHSNLIAAMQHADEEEDINKVLRYFSYEHFYVIYCKFWELDTDHDFLIDKENLIRYGNNALTYRIVDRIFSQVPRKFTCKIEGKMGYEDFVYFILSEEDKSSEPSLEYWFKCIDLDGNGIITRNEMQFFYEEQLHRMECMAQEPVLFEDILCQIVDMINPEDESYFVLRDLKRSNLSGSVFNILFNLNKFMAFETRDPFLIRQERENPNLTEWDRFAHREYIRLSMEEDAEDASNGSADVWDESLEAPF
ncbi:hypothetical protein OROGR_009342 [Orobanche gracilis]